VTDPRGNVRKVTFNSPPVYTDGYSTGGTISSDTRASGTNVAETTTYQYQPGTSLLLSATDALNRTTSFTYDSASNITSITRLSGTPNQVTTSFAYQVITYGYPQTITRLASVVDPIGNATQFAYDLKGNLVSKTDASGNTMTFSNDSEGRITSITDALGETTRVSHDGPDLAQVTDPLGRTMTFSTSMLGSGGLSVTASDALGHVKQSQYNALNELTQVTDPIGASTSFSYDGNGDLLSLTDPNNHSTQYTYDNLDRLSTRKDALQKSESYQYDGDGNLVQFTDRRGEVTTFRYDPFGRRVTKTTVLGTTNYLYDGTNPVQELSGGTVTANLITGGVDEYFQRTDSNGPTSFLTDALGSTVALTDNNGNAAAQYTYDPFGNTNISGVSANPYQYTGRENDGTGLYYYRARYYSPELQRFIAEDPIRFRGGSTDLYAYGVNSPTNFRDPSGRSYSWIHWLETFNAFLNVTGDPVMANAMADLVAAADLGTSTGTSWRDTRRHAMAGRKDNGQRQTSCQAFDSTSGFVSEAASMHSAIGDAAAIHDIQDSYASGHQYLLARRRSSIGEPSGG
jgi:RHS repeat-associated protein